MARGVKLTEQQKQYIVDNYGQKTSTEIAKELKIAPETVNYQQVRLGLRERRVQGNPDPPKPIEKCKYIPGQQIPVNVRELNRDRVARRKATVAEVYEYHVLLLVPNQYGNASTRTSMDYFDLATSREIVI